jgi:hypothetical protein
MVVHERYGARARPRLPDWRPREASMSDTAHESNGTRYVATMATPGYLPWSEDRPTFETAADAWEYLATERERQEDDATAIDESGPDELPFSSTVDELRSMASVTAADTLGTIYGATPGYDGSHDLGVAYSVSVATAEDIAADDEPYYANDDPVWHES